MKKKEKLDRADAFRRTSRECAEVERLADQLKNMS